MTARHLRHPAHLRGEHAKVRYRKLCFAVSSCVERHGDMIIEIDVGNPALEGRVIFDADLRPAESQQRARERENRPRRQSRW